MKGDERNIEKKNTLTIVMDNVSGSVDTVSGLWWVGWLLRDMKVPIQHIKVWISRFLYTKDPFIKFNIDRHKDEFLKCFRNVPIIICVFQSGVGS